MKTTITRTILSIALLFSISKTSTVQSQSIIITADTTQGCAPLTVNFSNTGSAGSDYLWDFGDGTNYFYSDSDTVHIYVNPGNYQVTLYAYDSMMNYIGSNYLIINVFSPPTSFYMSTTNVCPGDNVNFDSYENATSYFWDFGDTNTATGQWANHAYAFYGIKTVTLILDGQCGLDTIVQTISVDSTGTPDAGFGFWPDPSCPLQPVSFYPYSQGISYFWDFGDGDTSIIRDPIHTYDSAGFYTVSLQITNGCGNTDTKTNTVEIKDNAGFPGGMGLNINSPACPDEEVWINAPGGFFVYVWDAGDESPIDSTTDNWINHFYSDTGTYYVSVRIYNFCDNDTLITDSVVINNSVGFNKPVSLITISPACPDQNINILTTYGYLAYVWDFGDSTIIDSTTLGSSNFFNTDSITYVSHAHAYSDTGTYIVSVTLYNFCGNDTTLSDTIVVADNVGFTNLSFGNGSPSCPGQPVGMGTQDGHFSYVWNYGDNSPYDSVIYSGVRHAYTDTGTYNISVKITNHCGADTILYDTVKIGDNVGFPGWLNFNSNPNPVCPGGIVFLNAEDGFASYAWDFGDGTTATTGKGHAEHVYDSTGYYPVSVNITNYCGIDTTLYSVAWVDSNATFPNQMKLGAAPNPVCPGDLVSFEAQWGYNSYFWDFGDGDTIFATDARISHSYDSIGTYTVSVTITNHCGNQATIYVNINVINNAPVGIVQLFMPNTSACPGDEVMFVPQVANMDGGDSQNSYTYAWDLGDGTLDTTIGIGLSHIYDSTGSYTVSALVTNACGNSITIFATINIENNAMPILTGDFFGTANEGTFAGCPGDAVLFYFFGTGNNLWDFGDGSTASATEQIIAGFGTITVINHVYADTGTYTATLTLINACGNSFTDSISLIIETGLLVDGELFIQAPTGGGDYTTCDGVSFLGIGGSSYVWDFGDGNTASTISPTITHFYTIPGDYTVSVTITNSCGNSATYTSGITVIDGGGATASASVVSGLTCNGESDGSVIASASGGTEPYIYLWDDPSEQTSDTASNLSAGTYTVTVTDNNGCTGIASITLFDPAPISGTGSTIPSSCGESDGSAIISSITGGTPPYAYLWSSGGTNPTEDSLAAGTYSVTVTDSNGCSNLQSINLSDGSGATISGITIIDAGCNGGADGSIDITVSGGAPPYTYSWSNGETIQNVNNLTAGTYTVTVIDTNGCQTIQSGTINEPTAMELTESIVDADCGEADGSATVTASGGTSPYNYSWSTGTTGSTDSNLVAGAYTVTVTDANTCSSIFTIIVSNANSPVISVDATDVTCYGASDGAIDISVTGGTTPYFYLWLHDGSTLQDVSGLDAGSYTVILTDGSGCQTAQTIAINEPDILTVSTTNINAHCGYTDGSATATVTGGTSPYNYVWSSGGASSTETGLDTGTYTITITDTNSCMTIGNTTITFNVDLQAICIVTVDSSSTKNVVVWEKPVMAMGIDSFRVYRLIPGPGYVHIGSVPYSSLSIFVDTTNGVNPQTASYRYKLSVIDSCGNESELSDFHETIHLQVNINWPVVDLNWDNYEGFGFNYYRILRDSTGTGNWEVKDSVTNSNTTWTDIAPPTGNLRYIIEVVLLDVCGATKKAEDYNSSRSNTSTSIFVTAPTVDFTANTTSIAVGGSINFTDMSLNSPTSWEWTFAGGAPPSDTLQNPANITYNTPGSYDVTLIATNTNGSDTLTKSSYITVTSTGTAPVANFLGCTTINIGGSVDFLDVSLNSPIEWLWEFENGNPAFSIAQNPTNIVYNVSGNFDVTLIVTKGNDSDTLIMTDCITVNPVGISENVLEEAITIYPNPSSGVINLILDLTKREDVTINVFNMQGQLIYSEHKGRMSGTLNEQIDLSDCRGGIYHLQVITDKGICNKKIIIE